MYEIRRATTQNGRKKYVIRERAKIACRTGGIFSYSRRIKAKARRARSASRVRGEDHLLRRKKGTYGRPYRRHNDLDQDAI